MPFKLHFIKGKEISDEDLVNRYSESGDPEILGELYSRYTHLVYGVCLKYLKKREESMDAVMDIFEKLITEMPRHNILNFRSWLYSVTKNFCLMQIRSQKSHGKEDLLWIDDPGIFMEKDMVLHHIDRDQDDQKKNNALNECIDKLKHDQKECIVLFYYKNLCYREIAERMAVEEKKVKSNLQNAKRNLKICLEEKDGRKK